MGEIIVASEAMAAGLITRQGLRSRYRKVYRNVYAPKEFEWTARDQAIAAWLWSGRKAVLVGTSAAAVLGTRWLPDDAPAELGRLRHPAPAGIVVRADSLTAHEITVVSEMRCTTAARTAFDMGRRLPFDTAVVRIDALLNATRTAVEDVLAVADRHTGARHIRRLRAALDMVDAGSESPPETRLRLLLCRSGLPRPVTQIPVRDHHGRVRRRIDMGWPECMVGVEYDGAQHWTDARQHAEDIERLEFLAACGWTIVRVSAAQLRQRPAEVVSRVREAIDRRTRNCAW